MGWWARGTGELAFEVGEFLFYAVGAGEVRGRGIESLIVASPSKDGCSRKVLSELRLEGESGTKIQSSSPEPLSDHFRDKSFAGPGRGIEHEDF